MASLTVSRAALRMYGVEPDRLRSPELPIEATQALCDVLAEHGFDDTRPIHVTELPERQGFHLTQ
jgi:hypothetical protein